MNGKVILITLALSLGVSCATLQQGTLQQAKVPEQQKYTDCSDCVSKEDYNTCVDQNEMLRKYLRECIEFSNKSVQAIDQCQKESKAKAWRWFGAGTGVGGGIVGAIIILLWILL